MQQVLLRIATIDGAVLPKYHSDRAVAFDIAANADCSIFPGNVQLIKTGLIVQPEPGYWLSIVGRSSIHKKCLMLANNIGIIDPDFCGANDQLQLPVYNFGTTTAHIARGDRLAQGVIMPHYVAQFVDYVPLDESRGGFGSTGR